MSIRCATCGEVHGLDRTLSYDGHGINSCDTYRTRICSFRESTDREFYGPILSNSIRMFELLRDFVQNDPLAAHENGGQECFYCAARYNHNTDHISHSDNCVFLLSQTLVRSITGAIKPKYYIVTALYYIAPYEDDTSFVIRHKGPDNQNWNNSDGDAMTFDCKDDADQFIADHDVLSRFFAVASKD